MDFDNYDLDPAIYDEMFLQDGTPREHCQQLYETLTEFSAEELANIQERVARSFSNEGITFTVYGDDEADERIIPVDSIPRVMSAPDWREIEAGLTQRLKALNLFLEDVYGPSRSNDRFGVPRIVDDGVIPVDVVRGCPQYRIEMRGFSAPYGTWVAICGTDLVTDERRLQSAGRQPARPVRRVLHAREPQDGQGEPAPPVPGSPRAGDRALRAGAAQDPAGAGPGGAHRPDYRAADAGRVQLGLLRARLPGPADRSRARRGTRPAGQRRLRLHADHGRACAAST